VISSDLSPCVLIRSRPWPAAFNSWFQVAGLRQSFGLVIAVEVDGFGAGPWFLPSGLAVQAVVGHCPVLTSPSPKLCQDWMPVLAYLLKKARYARLK